MTNPNQRTDEHSALRLHRTVNEAVYRRFVDDAVNEGRVDAVDDLAGRNVVVHAAGEPNPIRGPDALKDRVLAYRGAFPDLALEVDAVIASGQRVVGRWTMTGTHEGTFEGVEPTGSRIAVDGVHVTRVEDGTIVELWDYLDALTLRRQLDATGSFEQRQRGRDRR